MALDLSLSYSERNDNELITLTDTTLNWGITGNIAPAAITTLTLDITLTTSDNSEIEFDQINLLHEFGPFANQAAMVFPLSVPLLYLNAVEYETDNGRFPDGIYTFQYVVNEGLGGSEDSYTENVLINGIVTVEVYDLLRQIPKIYYCKDCKTKQIMDIIFCYGLLKTLETSSYVAKHEELIGQLCVLEKTIQSGSRYSW
jgi:hypothetical protein